MSLDYKSHEDLRQQQELPQWEQGLQRGIPIVVPFSPVPFGAREREVYQVLVWRMQRQLHERLSN